MTGDSALRSMESCGPIGYGHRVQASPATNRMTAEIPASPTDSALTSWGRASLGD
jgi:hypothetical protein